MMAYSECSQTFRMFYFHPWGGKQGWVERKHMTAIFHGMSCLTFLELACLFGLFSIASRRWEKEMGALILLEAFVGKWCNIQRFVLVRVTLGSVSSATEVITITKTFPWSPKASPTVLVIMGFCCGPPLLWSAICWDTESLVLVLFAVGMWLK